MFLSNWEWNKVGVGNWAGSLLRGRFAFSIITILVQTIVSLIDKYRWIERATKHLMINVLKIKYMIINQGIIFPKI